MLLSFGIIRYWLGSMMNIIKKPNIRKTVVGGRPAYVAISKEKIAVFYRPENGKRLADAAYHRAINSQTE